MIFKKIRTLSQSEVQSVLLELAVKVDALCRKHGITYWIDGGTYLGAIRNKGFIPWDDDLDICLPIDDYYKLLTVIRQELIPKNPHYFLYNDYRPFPFFSDYLADTRYVRDYLYPVKIDIIKVKSIPDTASAIQLDKDYTNMMAFLFDKHQKSDISDKELFRENILKGSFLFKSERFLKKFNDYVKAQNEVNENHFFCYSFNDMYVKHERPYYTYGHIFPLKEVEFEGFKFYAPGNADAYLGLLYGDNYIQPPPKNEQRPFHDTYVSSSFPAFFYKRMIWFLYLLKAVKNSFRNIPKIRKEKAKYL